MTIIAVLADIHGNLPALRAVSRDLSQHGADHVIVAGDAINWGPFSAEVVQHIAHSQWAVVRGNHELYVLDFKTSREPLGWRDYTLLPWLESQLQGRWHNLIAAWPDSLSLRYKEAPLVRVMHGTPQNASEAIFSHSTNREVESALEGVEENVIITAHSHLAMERKVGPWHIVNPGSVGIPLDGEMAASYVLLESERSEWKATFRRIPFDLEPVLSEFEHQQFVKKCGPIALLVIKEFETARSQVLPFLKWRASNLPDEPITEKLLASYTEDNRNEYLPSPYRI